MVKWPSTLSGSFLDGEVYKGKSFFPSMEGLTQSVLNLEV